MKIEIIIGAIIVAAAIVLAPIALNAYKMNECVSAYSIYDNAAEQICIKAINGAS